MANGGVIGNAVIEVTVDSSRIKTGMDSASTSVKTQAAKIAAASDQVGASAKKQLTDFTGGIARFGAVAGTFYTFLRVGQQIGEMLKTGTDRAREFTDALDTRNASDALAKVNAEIAQIEGRIDFATRKPEGYIYNLMFGDTPGKMQEQLDTLRKTAGVLQTFENAKTQAGKKDAAGKSAKERLDAEAKTDASLRESAKRDADAAVVQSLDGVERVNEEERQFFAEIEQRRRLSQDREYQLALGRYSIAKQLYFIDQRRTVESEKQAKIDADKNKATEESLRRQEALANAINEQKGATADAILGMNTAVGEISGKLDQVANLLRGMN